VVITAKLQFKPSIENPSSFDVYDIESNNPHQVGTAHCSDGACTFTATVMDGKLTLTETLRTTEGESGFKLENGSQVSGGITMTYSSDFSVTKPD